MTKHITIEKAEKILRKLDGGSMPRDFRVETVAYSEKSNAYYVRWIDASEQRIYDDGIASDTADTARNAYSFRPGCCFSVIWLNETDDGRFAPVTAVLNPNDIKALADSDENLDIIDVV